MVKDQAQQPPSLMRQDGSALPTYRALMAEFELPRHELWPLLEAASGRCREFMIAHADAAAAEGVCALFRRMAAQRLAGVPVAYLTGWREFYGRPFWVNRHTLIPRIETELLIDTVMRLAQEMPAPLRLCDLGTGSGCIGITLALELRSAELTVSDQSADALAVARNNAARFGLESRVHFQQGCWYQALKPARQRFHGLISNPPYVAAGDPHLQQGDLRFEPASALSPAASGSADGKGSTGHREPEGADAGLSDFITLAHGARDWLEPGGFLLVEHGVDQQEAVIRIFTEAGLSEVRGIPDAQSRPRAVFGIWPGSSTLLS
ncbi:MAG: peptide chain release factor N(5)-glutamine methyltransferase [Burkholderiaceae bacterium]|nr:peptide chain release factor N(5)-glutamine methyltransferase [Burkholderiaceae bacterium]